MSNQPNKKVIRREKESGHFTQIHLSILKDKRLTAEALRILISILSDADNFNLSYELLMNRFDIGIKAVRSAFGVLEKCGYAKRKNSPRGYFYIISEFGNLNTMEDIEKNESKTIKPELIKELEGNIKKNNNLFTEYIHSIDDFIQYNENVAHGLVKLKHNNTNLNGLLDFYTFKKEAEKDIINKVRKILFDSYMEVTETLSRDYPKKCTKIYQKWLRDCLYANNHIPSKEECQNKWKHVKQQNQPIKVDYETRMGDRLSEEWHDNQ